MMNRRAFLHRAAALTAAGTATLAWPGAALLRAAEAEAAGTGAPAKPTVLVLLHLAGGWDGLSAVAPLADARYAELRPHLALDRDDLLALGDTCGLHPKLAPLRDLFANGRLAIIHGAGLPELSRDHARARDQWATARLAPEAADGSGWLGRALDTLAPPAADPSTTPLLGVSIGPRPAPPLAAAAAGVLALDTPDGFRLLPHEPELQRVDDLRALATLHANRSGMSPAAAACSTLLRAATERGNQVQQLVVPTPAPGGYPDTPLSQQLRLVARLLASGLPTRAYHVSQSGWDTHANQADALPKLLEELAGALAAFANDLAARGLAERVALLTTSEFGRGAAENASGGTDHGSAAPLFLWGGTVAGGHYGTESSLAAADLDYGAPRVTLDYRRVYATLLSRWLQVDAEPILGEKFELLPLWG